MNKFFHLIALCACFISAFGHTRLTVMQPHISHASLTDTIYIYETVTVYDTIIVRDTVRIKRMPEMPVVQPKTVDANFFASLTENVLILHENNQLQTTRSKTEGVSDKKNPETNYFSASPTATFLENGIIYENNNKKSDDHFKIKKMKELKLNILNYSSAAILAVHSFSGISAQGTNPPTEPLPIMPVQFSVAYPITTMGDRTKDYRYHFSGNLFYGNVGAIKGIEYGCVVNRVEYDMTGAQFAGIGNITREVNGVQFGGIFNVSSSVKGIQFGGIANTTNDVNGIQYGGIANLSGRVNGIQFGGIANLSDDIEYGIQFGGIANVSRNVNGIQYAGIANVAENVTGMQLAGIGNLSKDVTGFQFGGIFNHTETLRGVQLAGIVNITDTIEKGVPIALINIVRRGFYRAWELSFADYMNVGLSFKVGTQKFYTIFTAGAAFLEDKLWVTGFGFGHRNAISPRVDFQPEIMGYYYFPGDFRNILYTNSTHLKFGFVIKLNDRLGIVVAPSIYHSAANDDINGKYYRISPISPFYEKHRAEMRYNKSHIDGFGAGISVGLIWK